MRHSFTIIDSFRSTEALQAQGLHLPLGTWLVLDGRFGSAAELPPPGSSVVVVTPGGERIHTSIACAEVRHGSGAVTLAPAPDKVPRLSVLSVVENGA